MLYDVPKPTEAILISGGFGHRSPESPYRIVAGGGAWSVPILHRVQRFYIGANTVQVRVAAPSAQNVEVAVEATVVFRVRPDKNHITRAASRFEGSDRKEVLRAAYDIFGGETRAMIGQMTVEEMISDRMRLASDVLTNAEPKMAELGWGIDSFQISSITDDNNYIRSLSAPELARVEREAAVAEARRDAEIENERQKANRLKSEYQRDTDLLTSENIKQTAQAKAEAEASGPLAKAEADRNVVAKQSELAAEQALLREQELIAEVVKPAEAEAQRKRIEAEAEAQALRTTSEAVASNRGVIIDKQMVDQMPEMIDSLSEALGSANLTLVGDGQDLNRLLSQIASVAPGLRELAKRENGA